MVKIVSSELILSNARQQISPRETDNYSAHNVYRNGHKVTIINITYYKGNTLPQTLDTHISP